MTAPLTVRPIVFTAEPAAWLRMLDTLGGRRLDRSQTVHSATSKEHSATDRWTVLAFRAGRVAVHTVADDDALAGTTRLAFEVPDLKEFHAERTAALESAGAAVEPVTAGHGRMLLIGAADGTQLQVDTLEPGAGPASSATPVVMPLWYSPDVAGAQRTLEALGLQPRIRSDGGTWVDLVAPAGGGQHAAHHAPRPGAELSFEHDDVADLAARLDLAGVGADVIDESYGRTARIAQPERPDDVEARVWINEVQRDLYGYRRLTS